MGVRLKKNTTLCKVSFYTHAPFGNRIDAFDTLAPTLEGPVTMWTYQDQLGVPSGQVSISMKPKVPRQTSASVFSEDDWSSLLSNGDWWVLDAIQNKVTYRIGFGKIDTVGLAMRANMGEGQVTIRITGRTYGFGLEDTPVYWNPHDPAIGAMQAVILEQVKLFSGSPKNVIIPVLETLMGSSANVALTPTALITGHIAVPANLASSTAVSNVAPKSWIQLLDTTTKVQNNLRGEVALPQLISTEDPFSTQSIWASIDSWRNQPLNELFVDTNPLATDKAEAFLFLREKPFVNADDGLVSPWFQLTNWNMEASIIKDIALTKGSNRFNHFYMMGALTAAIAEDTYGLYSPVVDADSVGTHGLRRLHERTNYIESVTPEVLPLGGKSAGAPGGHAGFISESKSWQKLVASWNVLNHEYWNGRITYGEMIPGIRKGQKVTIINGPPAGYKGFPTDLGVATAGMSFYVEGFMHTWVDGESPLAETQILVSRGYVEFSRAADVLSAVASLTALVSEVAKSSDDPIAFDALNADVKVDHAGVVIEQELSDVMAKIDKRNTP